MKATEFLAEDITTVEKVPGGFQIFGPDGKAVSDKIYKNRALANQDRIKIDADLRTQATTTSSNTKPNPDNTSTATDTDSNKPADKEPKKPNKIPRLLRLGYRIVAGPGHFFQRLVALGFFQGWLIRFIAYITQTSFSGFVNYPNSRLGKDIVPVRDYKRRDWYEDPYIDYYLDNPDRINTFTGQLYLEIKTYLYTWLIMMAGGARVTKFISRILLRISGLGGPGGRLVGIAQFVVGAAGYIVVRTAVQNYATWSDPVAKYLAKWIMNRLLRKKTLSQFARVAGIQVASIEGMGEDDSILSQEEVASLEITWSEFVKVAADEIRSNPDEYAVEYQALKAWERQQVMQHYQDTNSV